MGLDMYLYVRKVEQSTGSFKHPNVKQALPKELQEIKELMALREITENEYTQFPDEVVRRTDYQIGYWRKANWIHGWIVKHCADGIDKCQDIHLDVDRIKELIGIMEKVLEKRDDKVSEELLPVTHGFFFGGYEYDEYYYSSLERSIKIFKAALAVLEWYEAPFRTEGAYLKLSKARQRTDYYIVYNSSW